MSQRMDARSWELSRVRLSREFLILVEMAVVSGVPSTFNGLYDVLTYPIAKWLGRRAGGFEDFEVISLLERQGGCSRVYYAFDRLSGSFVVLKVVPLLQKGVEARFNEEKSIALQLSSSPYIVKTIQSFTESYQGVLVSQHMTTDLYERFIGRPLPQKKLAFLFYQICNGVLACHRHGISHLDIKPENILLDEHDNPKLCDFGSAHRIGPETVFDPSFRPGSDFYKAPEILIPKTRIGPAADMWSLGILLFVLACGILPFAGLTERLMLNNYRQSRLHLSPLNESDLSSRGKNLLTRLLQIRPKDRPKITSVLRDPWFLEMRMV